MICSVNMNCRAGNNRNFLKGLGMQKATYITNIRNIIGGKTEWEYNSHAPRDKEDDYWKLDHNVMKYFEPIEEIEKPKRIEDAERLFKPFEYHTQYLEYAGQLEELIEREIGDYLDELFFILQRIN